MVGWEMEKKKERQGIRHPRKGLTFIVSTSIPKRSAGEAWPMPSVDQLWVRGHGEGGECADGCMEELTPVE